MVAQLGEITAAQNAIQGRLSALDSRLDENMKGSATVLGSLQQRLIVIDEAQKKIADLSSQMVSLKDILSDKQSRGAYGQGNDGKPSFAMRYPPAFTNLLEILSTTLFRPPDRIAQQRSLHLPHERIFRSHNRNAPPCRKVPSLAAGFLTPAATRLGRCF